MAMQYVSAVALTIHAHDMYSGYELFCSTAMHCSFYQRTLPSTVFRCFFFLHCGKVLQVVDTVVANSVSTQSKVPCIHDPTIELTVELLSKQ